jgi:hypothetical protein
MDTKDFFSKQKLIVEFPKQKIDEIWHNIKDEIIVMFK